MCNWENLCSLRDPVAVSPFARVILLIGPWSAFLSAMKASKF